MIDQNIASFVVSSKAELETLLQKNLVEESCW